MVKFIYLKNDYDSGTDLSLIQYGVPGIVCFQLNELK